MTSGPEGENPNEKELEGETPGDGGDGDKGGEFPNEKANETSEIIIPQDGGRRHSDCQSNHQEDKEPLVPAPNLWYKRL